MICVRGRVLACRAHRIDARLPGARLGARVRVRASCGDIEALVWAVDDERVMLAPLGHAHGIASGDEIFFEEGAGAMVLGAPLLGRAIDGCGRPLDGGEQPRGSRRMEIGVPPPQNRAVLSEPLWTGVRTIDALLTLARGMRVGIFGAPGTGKSHLLDAIAAGVDADAVTIALIGERGAEARRHLGRLDERTTIVCAPSDRSAGERLAAAERAFAHAARLRDCGLDVVVILDSLARYAIAGREVALACGELPGRAGYPPSVFSRLAGLCERAGATRIGSITLIATVLSDSADAADPIGEAARSHLDGHVVLSRRRSERGAFPAIDVPASLSRPMASIVTAAHQAAAHRVREAIAQLAESREARELGIAPADPREPALEAFLRQGPAPADAAESLASLAALADTL
jgi:FliI/YscN family ATPase